MEKRLNGHKPVYSVNTKISSTDEWKLYIFVNPKIASTDGWG